MSDRPRRWAPVATSAGIGVALAAYATRGLSGQSLGLALAVCAVAAGLLVVDALAWLAGAAVAGQGLLAAVYLGVLVAEGRDLDTGAPAFAAGLLLTGELAALARDAELTRGPSVLARRLLALAVFTLVAIAAGWLLLLATAVPVPGGALATLAGAVAAVAIPGLLLAARARPR